MGKIETPEREPLSTTQGGLIQILDALSLPLLVINARDYSVEWANRTAINFGRQGATHCFTISHGLDQPCDLHDHPCPLREMRETGRPVRVEHVHVDRKGRERIFDVHAYPIFDGDGELSHVVESNFEVTDQRQARELAETQGRLAAVGQLAAGIAHDFNNILQTIRICGEQLQQEGISADELTDCATTITDQAERGARLVRQIQDYSRESPTHPVSLDLDPFVRKLVELLDRTVPDKVRLVFETDFAPHVILGDQTQIEQVVTNLALNGRDAMPEGGELRVALTLLELGPEKPPPIPGIWPGSWVRLEVGDTGSGIPAEARPHVFEPFFTTKAEGEGTGLGLSQTYGIVKQHGGFIDFETDVGEGTTFRLYFPAEEALVEDQLPVTQAPVLHGQGEKILLVEDEEALLRVVSRTLTARGFEVIATSNGRQALEICRQRGPELDLLLSDVMMPDVDGRELVRRMRNLNPKIRCLLMTGYFNDNGTEELAPEFCEWLRKPFSIDSLVAKIATILNEVDR